MTAPHDTGYLLDVDNTLLDNDQITEDLKHHLEREFGNVSANHHRVIFEALRSEFGYFDYLGALQRYRFCGEKGQGSRSLKSLQRHIS